VNFNVLNTRDLERAKSFYGAVFGWGTLVLDGGFTAWTLGAYGDHLEELDPGMRERMAGAGAPAGFENVVASINPITDETPAHWGVTFAVDDADAIAGRAAELGGRVLMPPVDAPWVKMTVLADPQGATFIASQFVPENQDVPAQADAVQGS
jgi:predicted enzyme related to lactoylglutathione lyase